MKLGSKHSIKRESDWESDWGNWDKSLPDIVIDHKLSEKPDLISRDKNELIEYAKDSLDYLDYLIEFRKYSPSKKTSSRNTIPDIPTFVSLKILERHLSEDARSRTTIIYLDCHKFFDHWRMIRGKFIAKWEPEFSCQMKVCFCLETNKVGDDCEVVKNDDSKVIPWGDYDLTDFNVDIFVKALWLTVMQLA